VAVKVAAGAVLVLGGAGGGMPGQDLGIAQRHACVLGVGDVRYLPSIMKKPWSQPVSVYEASKARKVKKQQRGRNCLVSALPHLLLERQILCEARGAGSPIPPSHGRQRQG
jgi:hypothetical protein